MIYDGKYRLPIMASVLNGTKKGSYNLMKITNYVDDDVQLPKDGELFGRADYDEASNEDLQIVASPSAIPAYGSTQPSQRKRVNTFAALDSNVAAEMRGKSKE